MQALFWLVLAAVEVHGLVAGISFDVATVKLPTRKRIGVVAYAQFARSNDMGNGIVTIQLLQSSRFCWWAPRRSWPVPCSSRPASCSHCLRHAQERSRISFVRPRQLRAC